MLLGRLVIARFIQALISAFNGVLLSSFPLSASLYVFRMVSELCQASKIHCRDKLGGFSYVQMPRYLL